MLFRSRIQGQQVRRNALTVAGADGSNRHHQRRDIGRARACARSRAESRARGDQRTRFCRRTKEFPACMERRFKKNAGCDHGTNIRVIPLMSSAVVLLPVDDRDIVRKLIKYALSPSKTCVSCYLFNSKSLSTSKLQGMRLLRLYGLLMRCLGARLQKLLRCNNLPLTDLSNPVVRPSQKGRKIDSGGDAMQASNLKTAVDRL